MPAKSSPPGTFTLRQVENHGPCGSGYRDALRRLNSSPVPNGSYATFRRRTDNTYGPDDPISIAAVAKILDSSELIWVCERFLTPTQTQNIQTRTDKIIEGAYIQAITEVLSTPAKAKSKPKTKK